MNITEEFNKNMKSEKTDGGGLRENEGKLRYDLVNPYAHEDMIKVLTFGSKKYPERNWERGMKWTSIIASMKRHIAAIEKGEDFDKESGLPHIAHVQCNAHFLNAYYYIFQQGDDRPKNIVGNYKIGIDIDDVIANFTKAWIEKYNMRELPKSWNFDRKMGDRFEKMRQSDKLDDFYLNLEPLIKQEDLLFEPYCYITSRSVSIKTTRDWLDKWNFPAKEVISVGLGKSKVEAAKQAGIDIFIDDSYSNFIELNSAGILTYLLSKPHNKRFDVGHLRIENINDIPILKI